MKKYDSNIDIRKECEQIEFFRKEFIGSNHAPKELLKDALGNMSLKNIPFSILQPATEYHISSLRKAICVLDGTFLTMSSMNDVQKNHL